MTKPYFARLGLLVIIAMVFGCQETPTAMDAQASFNKGKNAVDTWRVPGDFTTIELAIAGAADGDWIMVGPGTFAGALVDKAVHIEGVGNAIIDDGPAHGSGLIQGFRLLAGSDGSSITGLTFTTDLTIMNGEAVDGVTISRNTFLNSVQAVSNWVGSGWTITHNEIVDLRTRCGGGIGVLVADFTGGTVTDNVVSHNKISGTLHVSDGDCGGYSGSGIVLFADFRFGRSGAVSISENRVVQNDVAVISDTPGVVDIVAFELTDTGGNDDIVCGNAIGFNDWRGTETQMVFSPAALADCNDISRNLGDNRGHGSHPSLFGPGGN